MLSQFVLLQASTKKDQCSHHSPCSHPCQIPSCGKLMSVDHSLQGLLHLTYSTELQGLPTLLIATRGISQLFNLAFQLTTMTEVHFISSNTSSSSPSTVLRSQKVQGQSAHVWYHTVAHRMGAFLCLITLAMIQPLLHERLGLRVPGGSGPGFQFLSRHDLDTLTRWR